jgi:hypothetical protein
VAWGNTVAALRHERPLTDALDAALLLYSSRYDSETTAEILATPVGVSNDLHDLTASGRLASRPAAATASASAWACPWFDVGYRQSFNQDDQIDYRARPREVFASSRTAGTSDRAPPCAAACALRYIADGDRAAARTAVLVSHDLRSRRGG